MRPPKFVGILVRSQQRNRRNNRTGLDWLTVRFRLPDGCDAVTVNRRLNVRHGEQNRATDATVASDLACSLGLDAGYLSRILRSFTTKKLVERTHSPADRRRHVLRLTARGRRAFAPLEQRAQQDVAAMISSLSGSDQRALVAAMETIRGLLEPRTTASAPFLLRSHEAGDMGWVVQQHGATYAREWGYNAEFEALVARIVADFLDHYDAGRERCWIAEKDGENVGSVFLVRKSKTVAKLRLLLVDPRARGLGIGKRLVDECIRFARQAGYRKLTLWTQSELDAARGIYQRAGFTCVRRQPNDRFGKKGLVAETWDLRL
jgi:DNA-binding MarR family transcriptional regulator/ribosomal protein S18 acetylase RimI-like enzyme